MSYKNLVNENSTFIKIDEQHSCTEEQLRSFLSNVFNNFERMCELHKCLSERLTKHDPTNFNNKNFDMTYNFDEAVRTEYQIQKLRLSELLQREIREFMNDTQRQ